MSTVTMEWTKDARPVETTTVHQVRRRYRLPRRGSGRVWAGESYTVTGPATMKVRASRWPLKLAAVLFDVACLGGFAVLIWYVVMSLQPVSVLSFPV